MSDIGSWDPRAAHRVMPGQGVSMATAAQHAEAAFRSSEHHSDLTELEADGIRAQLKSLHSQLQKTHMVFEELVDRIQPILRPDFEDSNAKPGPEPRPPLSELELSLIDAHSQIRLLQYRIGQVHERVQL